MSKKLDFEETKRVSTTKGFLGYKNHDIVEQAGVLVVWKKKRSIGTIVIIKDKKFPYRYNITSR